MDKILKVINSNLENNAPGGLNACPLLSTKLHQLLQCTAEKN